MANKSGIHIKESKKGTFTTAAKKRGMGVQEFARRVMANKDNYSTAMVRKANFARNATKFKHEVGGEVTGKFYNNVLSKSWYDNPIVADPLEYGKGIISMRKDPRYTISEPDKFENIAKRDTQVNPKTGKKLSEEYKEAMPYTDYAVEVTDNETGGKYIYPMFSKQVMAEEMGKKGYNMSEFAIGGLVMAGLGLGQGIANLIGGARQRRKAKAQAKAQAKAMREGQRMSAVRDEKLSELEPQQEYAPTFACGGKVKRKMEIGGRIVPAEVEGGESMELPNGQGVNIEGPTHAQGGVDMNLPEGTRIFSDKIKVPETNMTFSDKNKKLTSKISMYEKILDNPKATKLAKSTAKRMLSKLNADQDGLFELQQKLNNNSTGTPAKQFEDGGFSIPEREEVMPGMQDWMLSEKAFNTAPTGLDAGAEGGGVNWGKVGNVASTIGTLAPALYNIGQGLFGRTQKFNASDYYNPNEAAATNLMRRRSVNMDPMLEANRTAASTARYNARNVARTRGELLGSYAPIAAGQSRADASVYMAQQQAENQYRGETAGMMANLGAQKAATNLQVADMNARSAAARRGMLGAGLSQIGQYAQLRQQASGLKEADRMRVNALKQMFPDVWGKLGI